MIVMFIVPKKPPILIVSVKLFKNAYNTDIILKLKSKFISNIKMSPIRRFYSIGWKVWSVNEFYELVKLS